jgi:acetate---CoA ligase (ADP-forming)
MIFDQVSNTAGEKRRLDPLMAPRSIAVLGASPRKGAHGNSVIRNLLQFGFCGDIYPIHPSAEEVLGFKTATELAALPIVPDCVVVCLSADKVIGALEQAAAFGIRAGVIYASGFAETDEGGAVRQRQLGDLAEKSGMVICGPNCLGLANFIDKAILYSAGIPQDIPIGDVAILSHSGSACIALSSLTRFGVSHMVSVGNGAIVDVDQYMDFLVDEPAVRTVALFIESIRHPHAFADAAMRLRAAGKTVIALKVGRSDKGAAATAAHTGSLSGSQEVYQAFFTDCGVTAVDDLDEMIETIVLMSMRSMPGEGRGIAVMNVSGGENALTCDIGQDVGIDFAELSPATIDRLMQVLPSFGYAANPLDATGAAVFDMQLYRACLEALANDPNVALVAVSQDCPLTLSDDGAANYGAMTESIADFAGVSAKPIVFYTNFSGGHHPTVAAPLHAAGIPVLQGARPSLKAIRRLLESQAFQPRNGTLTNAIRRDDTWHRRLSEGVALTERESKAFLAACGLAITREAMAKSPDEAVELADSIGYPIALKIESPDLPHKSDIGGVVLGLADPEQVRIAYDGILKAVRAKAPDAELRGVLVQEMVSDGIEVIVGASSEEPFGMALVFGAGGVLVDLLRDSALTLGAFNLEAGRHLIERTQISKLLKGYRGGEAADMDALAQLLSDLSRIADIYQDVIEAIDLNPVRASADGARIVDALVIPKKSINNFGEQS